MKVTTKGWLWTNDFDKLARARQVKSSIAVVYLCAEECQRNTVIPVFSLVPAVTVAIGNDRCLAMQCWRFPRTAIPAITATPRHPRRDKTAPILSFTWTATKEPHLTFGAGTGSIHAATCSGLSTDTHRHSVLNLRISDLLAYCSRPVNHKGELVHKSTYQLGGASLMDQWRRQ